MWRNGVDESLNRNAWASPWVVRIQGQPSWVWKAAVVTVLLVFVLPLVLLAAAAMAMGAIVLLVLLAAVSIVARLALLWRRVIGRGGGQPIHATRNPTRNPSHSPSHDDRSRDQDGRENVRVIRRDA